MNRTAVVAGVVDQHVEPSEALDDRLCRGLDRVALLDVARHDHRGAALGLDRRRDLLEPLPCRRATGTRPRRASVSASPVPIPLDAR